jgi:hypothetical protein
MERAIRRRKKNRTCKHFNTRKPLSQEVFSVHHLHEIQDGKEKMSPQVT